MKTNFINSMTSPFGLRPSSGFSSLLPRLVGGFLVLSLFLTNVAFGAETPPAAALKKTHLALNWKPEPQFGGFYAAQTSGAYQKHGLEVEIAPGGAGTPVVQMVAAGRSEFGIASADEIAVARARGADVVALFAVYQTNPQCLMARKERGAKTVKQLFQTPGPLALQKGLPYALFLTQKYPASKAQIVPYLGGIANFLADAHYAQQGFYGSEPLAASKAGAAADVFLVADEGFNPYTAVLISRGAFLASDAATAKAMTQAVREGWQSYLADPSSANAVMAGLNPSISPETFAAGAAAQKALIETSRFKGPTLGKMTAERWNALTDDLKKIKLIDAKPSAESLFRNL